MEMTPTTEFTTVLAHHLVVGKYQMTPTDVEYTKMEEIT